MAVVVFAGTLDFIPMEFEECHSSENRVSTVTPIEEMENEHQECSLFTLAAKKGRQTKSLCDRALPNINILPAPLSEDFMNDIPLISPQIGKGILNILCTYRL